MTVALLQKFNPLTSGNFNLVPQDLTAVTKEHTGFTSPADVIINYDSTTQKVTITGTVEAYYQDALNATLISGYVSAAHTNTVGNVYWLYADGPNSADIKWSTNTFPGMDKILITVVLYFTNYKFALRECHGLNMPADCHYSDHFTVGTYKLSGAFTPASYVLGSNTATNRRPGLDAIVIRDEDLPTTNAALLSASNTYQKLYLTGLEAAPVTNFTGETAEIVKVSGAQPYYNQLTGGSWQDTLMSVGAYQAIFVYETPVCAGTTCQTYRHMFVQGQLEGNLSTIQALTPSNVNLGDLAINDPEIVCIGKIIIRFIGGNWELTSVENITGSRASQVLVSSGSGLTAVATDITLSGNGTTGSPLSVVGVAGATTPMAVPFVSATGTLVEDSLFYDSINKRLGVGVTPTTHALEVVAPAVTGAETVARFSVSDEATSYLDIINTSNTDGLFIPQIRSATTSSAGGLYVSSLVGTDTGAVAAMTFASSKTAGAVIASRPLFKFQNYTTVYGTVTAGGLWGLNGSITPQSSLHLDRGNNATGTMQFTSGTTTGVLASDGYRMIFAGTTGDFSFNQQEAAATNWQVAGNTYLSLAGSGDVGLFTFASTLGIALTGGTTAQRSASPSAGMFRYNTTLATLESFQNNVWAPQAYAAAFSIDSPSSVISLFTPPTSTVSYTAQVYVADNSKYAQVTIYVVNKNGTWEFTPVSVGDTLEGTFAVNSGTGVLTYTSYGIGSTKIKCEFINF